ncbi:MAG: class I SAM-dependent methyltransferase [Holophagaceae bacterium]|nr:class I SAM-dependent methyltransferase [Holophagaceae bacterium]
MTDLEKSHFEVAGIWEPENWHAADLERMDETIRVIPEGASSLLDAGCGNGLFLKRLAQLRPDIPRIHGADRSSTALQHVTCDHTQTEINAMPFADQSFEVVSALQVLEHLPGGVFEQCLAELARITRRYILISVPFQEDLERNLIGCPSCRSRFSPYHHVRSFSRGSLASLFETHGFQPCLVDGLGETETLRGWRTLREFFSGKALGVNPYPFEIPCPMCAARLEPSHQIMDHAEPRPASHALHRIRRGIKRVWPKERTPTRLLALFESTTCRS